MRFTGPGQVPLPGYTLLTRFHHPGAWQGSPGEKIPGNATVYFDRKNCDTTLLSIPSYRMIIQLWHTITNLFCNPKRITGIAISGYLISRFYNLKSFDVH